MFSNYQKPLVEGMHLMPDRRHLGDLQRERVQEKAPNAASVLGAIPA